LRRKGVTLQFLWEEYAQANLIEHYCAIDLDSSIFERYAKKREWVKRAYNGERATIRCLLSEWR
jgi:hypothetical protein